MEQSVVKPTKVTKPRGRPKTSAAKLALKQTARITAKRAIKSSITTSNPLLKLVLVAGLGAVASYFINKQ